MGVTDAIAMLDRRLTGRARADDALRTARPRSLRVPLLDECLHRSLVGDVNTRLAHCRTDYLRGAPRVGVLRGCDELVGPLVDGGDCPRDGVLWDFAAPSRV